MKVSFGLKAHSGWAALVALGSDQGKLEVVDRRRMELVTEEWAKQPYHAAEELEAANARKVVARGIREAHKYARVEIAAAIKRIETLGHRVQACGVLMSDPMPDWTVRQILAVHFRMHKAEGVLFREALAEAACACGVKTVLISEKSLNEHAETALAAPWDKLQAQIASLGKSAGPPWGKDQKDAALAAMIAFGSDCISLNTQ